MKSEPVAVSKQSTVMGKVTSVYGVKGWVKVLSYTQPRENLCKYKHWTLEHSGKTMNVKVQSKVHGKGVIAQIDGCQDRDLAKKYCDYLITIPKDELPELGAGEFYWHQLEGLQVKTVAGTLLGKVNHLLETGSNDVLVVRKCEGSIDGKERLIPYLPEDVVKNVDLSDGLIEVDWDPEF